jgi:hypothetical protein
MHLQHEKGNPQLFEICSNIIMFVIRKDNNFLELQGLLEHNDFTCKPTTKIK